MIPKVIHYCWFGGNPLPELAIKCIQSWKRFLPDFEIIEWNESNFDVHMIPYTSEAYKVKKYAFVSDYARFWILHKYGGIYFDVDVEVIKPLESILACGSFLGTEGEADNDPLKLNVNPGLGFAAYPSQPFLGEMLEIYSHLHFVNPDGTYNTKTVVHYTTELLCKYGLKGIYDIQSCADFQIYPREYFSPKNAVTREVVLTDNTYTIHHYDGSWLSKSIRRRQRIKEILGPKVVSFVQAFRGKLKV